ncbi:ferritin-like domain-containing protein [Streptomyces zagrosensis]|uniref:Iminophenyl-pyruvate dimer synthase domain-containing protein n=1 Tax=Streptomyces zagrosensis TaxID=1042984 RepID=A0A7W9V2X6_9ACTN|nr:ferritin-like domain-containing protein [Streptomyces zagrosensis]MBB5939751.1 hypothetical protein [Streptomyces zagrosensis]
MTQSLVRQDIEERDAAGVPEIKTMAELRSALQAAMTLEYTTIPAYLSGLWTIPDRKGKYQGLANILQQIVICEMRHLSIAANVLIAVGGFADVRSAAAPTYPRLLPAGFEQLKKIPLLNYGEAYAKLGVFIEQPENPCEDWIRGDVNTSEVNVAAGAAPTEGVTYVRLGKNGPLMPFVLAPYPSIGAFYTEVKKGITALVAQYGNDYVFPNKGSLGNQYLYFGGQDYIGVSDENSALALLSDVIDEGEGDDGKMWDENGDISHYFAFLGLSDHKKFVEGDVECNPTGHLDIPTDSEVTQIVPDPRMYLYELGTPAYERADEFNTLYAALVDNLHIGFNGCPGQVDYAIGQMNLLEARAAEIYKCTVRVGGKEYRAAPTFELPPYVSPLLADAVRG